MAHYQLYRLAEDGNRTLVVNVPTEPYRYKDPDEYRLEPHGALPYDWTRKDG